jgi:hypothetical protein
MGRPVINTREDLEAVKGTKHYDEFMERLRGSMTRWENVAVYPDNYNDPDYDGPVVEPVWEEVEDLSLIERFGFTKADFS